jgi:hypothetical protein
MKREEFDRIVNDDLDGVATPEEREALKAYLGRDAEARERYGDWKELFASLDDAGLEEAPPDLSPSVMRAVVAQRRVELPASRSAGWVETFRSVFRVPTWRSALTFASGVGVGAAAIALVAGNLVGGARYGSSDLSGAMMPRDAGPSGRVVEERTLQAGAYSISAGTRRTSDGVVLRIEASGGGADGAVLVAAYDGGALHPEALRMDPPSAGDVEVGPNRIRFGLQGAGTFTVSLRSEEAQSAPLELELRSGAQSSRTALRTDFSESR